MNEYFNLNHVYNERSEQDRQRALRDIIEIGRVLANNIISTSDNERSKSKSKSENNNNHNSSNDFDMSDSRTDKTQRIAAAIRTATSTGDSSDDSVRTKNTGETIVVCSNEDDDDADNNSNSSNGVNKDDRDDEVESRYRIRDALKNIWNRLPMEWRCDKEFILTLLETTAKLPRSSPFLPSQSDFERLFPQSFRSGGSDDHKQIVLAWTKQVDFPKLYKERNLYLPPTLCEDKEVCYQYCKQIRKSLSDCHYEVICDDIDVVRAAVSLDGMELQYASYRLQQQFDVVKLACETDGRALEFCPSHCDARKRILGDRSFMIDVVLPSKPPSIRGQTKSSGTIWKLLPTNVKETDEELALVAFQNGLPFRYVPKQFVNTHFMLRSMMKITTSTSTSSTMIQIQDDDIDIENTNYSARNTNHSPSPCSTYLYLNSFSKMWQSVPEIALRAVCNYHRFPSNNNDEDENGDDDYDDGVVDGSDASSKKLIYDQEEQERLYSTAFEVCPDLMNDRNAVLTVCLHGQIEFVQDLLFGGVIDLVVAMKEGIKGIYNIDNNDGNDDDDDDDDDANETENASAIAYFENSEPSNLRNLLEKAKAEDKARAKKNVFDIPVVYRSEEMAEHNRRREDEEGQQQRRRPITKYCDDYDIMKFMMHRSNGKLFGNASDRLRRNVDIILSAISTETAWSFLRSIPFDDMQKINPIFISKCIKHCDGKILPFVPILIPKNIWESSRDIQIAWTRRGGRLKDRSDSRDFLKEVKAEAKANEISSETHTVDNNVIEIPHKNSNVDELDEELALDDGHNDYGRGKIDKKVRNDNQFITKVVNCCCYCLIWLLAFVIFIYLIPLFNLLKN